MSLTNKKRTKNINAWSHHKASPLYYAFGLESGSAQAGKSDLRLHKRGCFMKVSISRSSDAVCLLSA